MVTSRLLSAVSAQRRRPLLVTGVPRSGTTWLARQLAEAPGCAMAGREPMNPKPGQYRLAGTVDGWVRLETPSRRQLRALRLSYAGWAPRTYGKYGHRQWATGLPGTRTVVKDPFAVLSVAAVVQATSAVPVLVYRHPAAVLASYRRMGWRPDVADVAAALPASHEPAPAFGDEDLSGPRAMAWFWSALNGVALRDMAGVPDALVVSHEELASGGPAALAVLFDACGLGRAKFDEPLAREHVVHQTSQPAPSGQVLHRLDRPSSEVATAWRSAVDPADLELIETLTRPTFDALQTARLSLL